MLLAYVDESFTKSWYYMAALLVPDRQAVSLTDALDRVAAEAATTYGVPVDAELHGHDLFQAKRDWEGMADLHRARIGVYNDAFQAIGDHSVKIILRGVDITALNRRYSQPEHPHTIVLGHLLERINDCAQRCDEFSLVIADEVDEQAKHRNDLSTYRVAGTGGYRSSRLPRIVDTLHFAPSRASRLVQAADMVAFLHRRMELHQTGDERAFRANQALWARITPRIVHRHCWQPRGDARPETHEGPAPGGA